MKLSNVLILSALALAGWIVYRTASRRRQPAADAGGAGVGAPGEPWDAVDEASAESFPASDPSAKY